MRKGRKRKGKIGNVTSLHFLLNDRVSLLKIAEVSGLAEEEGTRAPA